MATGVSSWSTTAATNATADSAIGWAEGQAPSTVNDSARAMMQQLAYWYADTGGGVRVNATVGGTAAAVTLTSNHDAVTSLAAGQMWAWIVTNAPTGATTLAVDGLTAKNVMNLVTALVANDFAVGDLMVVMYDGTQYQLLTPPRSAQLVYSTGLATSTTSGLSADTLPIFDSAASNVSKKVTVANFFKAALANITAKATPVVADTAMIADSAASGAAKISTLAQIFQSFVNLTSKSTPIAADSFPIIDSAASNAAKNLTFTNFFATFRALQATQETGSSNALFVTPGVQHFHQSASKAWVNFTPRGTNGAATVNASYNVSGVSRTAAGTYTITFTTAMSSTTYCTVGTSNDSALANLLIVVKTPAAATCVVFQMSASTAAGTDLGDTINVQFFGDL